MSVLSSRSIGWLLWASSFVILLLSPKGFQPLHMGGFLGLFIVGALLATGVIGTHPAAIRARRAAKDHPKAANPVIAMAIKSREFRYPIKRSARVVLPLLLLLPLAEWAFAAFLVLTSPDDRAELAVIMALAMAIPMAALFAFLVYLMWRVPLMHVRVDSDGIVSCGLFLARSLKWDEIVALTVQPMRYRSADYGTKLEVWSASTNLSFGETLEGIAELVNLISARTTLRWQ